MQAMILAAGLGKRMRPLTDHTPKPLLKVAGKPLLEYQIERLILAGATSILINVSYLADQIEAFIAARDWLIPIRLSKETSPLETAGGIQKALEEGSLNSDEPILLVNGDIWCDFDLTLPSLNKTVLNKAALAHLILVDNPNHNPSGDFILGPDQQVSSGKSTGKSANKIKKQESSSLTFSGISLIHPSLIPPSSDQPPPLALGPLLKSAADQGRVTGEYFSGYWLDVGTPERLAQLERYIINKQQKT